MEQAKTTGKALRGAVIGYGGAFNMGKAHLDWMSAAGIVPTAVCDVDATRVTAAKADFADIRTYTSVSEFLKDDEVDVVVIITPHDTHADLTVQVLNAGKSVVVEKPMAITSGEATQMIEAARKNDVALTVFHNRRRDGDFVKLKETILEKKLIGEVFSIQAGFAGYGHPGHWWRSNKAISGGTFYDWGAHFTDWVLNLMPGQKVVNVSGFYHKKIWHDVTNEDHVQAIIRFDSGAHADISFSAMSSLPMPRWRIQGEQGAILDEGFINEQYKLSLYKPVDGVMMKGELKYKDTPWADHSQFYQDFNAHLTEGAPLAVTPESARRVIAVIEAAEKSALSGQSEKVAYEDVS